MKINVEVFCLRQNKYLFTEDIVSFLPDYQDVFGDIDLVDDFENNFTLDFEFLKNLNQFDTFHPECLIPKFNSSKTLYNMLLDAPIGFYINDRTWVSNDRLIITLIPFHIDVKHLLMHDIRDLDFYK